MDQNSETLTPRQFKFLLALHVLGTSLISIPAGLIADANQDAWIAFLIAIFFDLCLLLLYNALRKLTRSQNIAQLAEALLGKWGGGFYCLNMAIYGLFSASALTWYLSNFLNEFATTLPTFYINLLFVLIIVLAITSGPKVIGRLAEIAFPIVATMLLLIILFLLPRTRFEQLFPIFDNPLANLLKATLRSSSYIGMTGINLLIFYPTKIAPEQKKSRFLYFTGYFYGIIFLFTLTFVSVLTLGGTATSANNSTYYLSMLTTVKGLFERFESLLALIWFVTLFFKTITYYSYATVHLVQLLKIKNEKSLVLSLGLILLAATQVVYLDNIQEAIWDSSTWIVYALVTVVLLPLILLMVGKLKKAFNQKDTH